MNTYNTLSNDTQAERDERRLRNAYAMMRELFPDASQQDALIMAGAIVKAMQETIH